MIDNAKAFPELERPAAVFIPMRADRGLSKCAAPAAH
jgi:hypothetical protein